MVLFCVGVVAEWGAGLGGGGTWRVGWRSGGSWGTRIAVLRWSCLVGTTWMFEVSLSL